MTFYVGQRVVAISAPDHNNDLIGHSGEVLEVVPGGDLSVYVLFEGNHPWWCETTSLSPVFVGPPLPPEHLVAQKCRKLWNESKFVKAHPNLAY